MGEPIERACVTGADPEKRFPVPIEGQFDGEEFRDAPELGAIADALIAEWPEFHALGSYPPTIRYMWRARGQKSKGAAMFGNCKKVSGLTKHFGRTDWVLEIAADLLRDMKATNWQVEALLFHELKHLRVTVDEETDEATYSYVREEYSAFADEIKRYGAWHGELESVSAAFAQAPLFARGKASKGNGEYKPSGTVMAAAESLADLGATIREPGAVEATRTNLVTADA